MKTHTIKNLVPPCACVVVTALGITTVSAADTPSPTPTPHHRTLGDVKLKTDATTDDNGRVVISDANLAELSDGGTVTVGGTAAPAPIGGRRRKDPDDSDRTRWRKVILDQKLVIAGLDRKRLRIEAEIDLVEQGRLNARALARIQKAEIDLRAVEREIRIATAELGRLIREARRHGAEPGWFR